MKRRGLLASAGACLASGCLSGRTDSTPGTESATTRPPTTSEPPTQTATETGPELRVDVLALQPALFTFSVPDAIAVTSPETTQYLFVHVEVESGTAPSREDLRFELGEESVGLSDRKKLGSWFVQT